MYRRSIVSIVVAAGILVSASALDLHAAGPGIFRSSGRPRGQATVRTYRSYSVAPGNADVQAETPMTPGYQSGSRPVPRNSGQSSRSKPSYMRADSKAAGRFGQ